ncbi:hypothetical protein [Dolichospermum heterosporum]|uniref:Uncharacterized protein n=1 Tax=Dolichospermum heterosporum TAC447 TaxID=747523 RepID=A0ABY5LX01_9CYAN|nr:hypothetical protein [Dolichospermum heterosporum]UUO15267.1 hypothetical protein NG743_25285 [Dolichospermum heterosporum TAC447]
MNNRKHGFGREGWSGNIPLDSTPPEIITIPGGQVLTANAGELVNSDMSVTT